MGPINNLWDNAGIPLDQQRFTWRDMVGNPISKLDDDAFTRVRIILLNGLENDALRLKHMAARFNEELRVPLAKLRRVEQHQATLINWLLSADHSPLETKGKTRKCCWTSWASVSLLNDRECDATRR